MGKQVKKTRSTKNDQSVKQDDPVMGRPSEFATPEEFQEKVEEYFQYIQGEFSVVTKRDENGEPYEETVWTRKPEPGTITGLALFLGFESRQSFYDYEKRVNFSYTVKKARLRIENEYEKALHGRNPTGPIFALKNLGWSDRQEVDHRSSDGSMSPPTPIKFTKGSREE